LNAARMAIIRALKHRASIGLAGAARAGHALLRQNYIERAVDCPVQRLVPIVDFSPLDDGCAVFPKGDVDDVVQGSPPLGPP
jgi:hypothetical protein